MYYLMEERIYRKENSDNFNVIPESYQFYSQSDGEGLLQRLELSEPIAKEQGIQEYISKAEKSDEGLRRIAVYAIPDDVYYTRTPVSKGLLKMAKYVCRHTGRVVYEDYGFWMDFLLDTVITTPFVNGYKIQFDIMVGGYGSDGMVDFCLIHPEDNGILIGYMSNELFKVLTIPDKLDNDDLYMPGIPPEYDDGHIYVSELVPVIED